MYCLLGGEFKVYLSYNSLKVYFRNTLFIGLQICPRDLM